MNNNQVERFYKFLKSKPELLKKIQNEFGKHSDNKISPEFIKNEVIPIAKENNFDVPVEDILEYEENVASKLKNISEEELSSVSGGKMDSKSIASGILSLTLLCGATGLGGTAHAMSPEVASTSTSYSVSQVAKSALETAGSIITWPLAKIWSVIYPDPAKPKITRGEFPFKFVYEINGENKVIEDTVVCKYEGIGWNESEGKYRKWKNYLASGNDTSIVLVSLVDSSTRIHYDIYYQSGYAEYYMGAPDVNKSSFPRFYENLKGSSVSAEELLKYGIKIISWEHSQPIANEFK